MWSLAKPYLIFLGSEADRRAAKTGLGLRQWAADDCRAQWRLSADAVDLGLPSMTPPDAAKAGIRTMVIGVAPFGGQLPDSWIEPCVTALDAGLDVVAGLHVKLAEVPRIAEAAARTGRRVHDVRHSPGKIPLATGRRRPGRRLLTVGTDCSSGKKYTALALTQALRARGVAADFRATGQTGIMIAGAGIAVDAVVSDFIAGAAEQLSPEARPDHWDIVEGQGAILHPAYAGVTLGLLHGTQPDALVLCHDPSRRVLASFPDYAVPSIAEVRPVYERLAKVTNPAARFVGIALDTSSLPEREARLLVAATAEVQELPCCDPLRFGIDDLIARIEAIGRATN